MSKGRRVLVDEERAIQNNVKEMALLARGAVEAAMGCLQSLDKPLALNIIDADITVNELLHQVQQGCLIALATQQPVAGDLRKILASNHIAIELERIADHAADVCKIVIQMGGTPLPHAIERLAGMAEFCNSMLDAIMEAYEAESEEDALAVATSDARLDALEHQVIHDVLAWMAESPDNITAGTHYLWISHNLERAGD